MRLCSRTLLACALLGTAWAADPAEREHYAAPTWKPRVGISAADALRGDFWPASPKVEVDYSAPGFDLGRVPQVPAPGVHPRVLTNPDEIAGLRAQVALGAQAPAAFQVQWARIKASQSAFYALVAQDDALGQRLARDLAGKLKTLEPKLDLIDAQPDGENLWAVEKSFAANGEPNAPGEIWSLLDYDYLHGWMTPEERESARRILARLIKGRISNYLTCPDHFMINNHQGFGMEHVRLLLLIEGEEGFDRRVLDLAQRKARAMLDWYLDRDGMCYESIKGWLNVSAFTALGMRQPELLKHGHLRSKMAFFRAALRWEGDHWQIRDEMRASAFHVIWMMHHLYPQERAIDLLYQATFPSHDFLTDAKAKWPGPVGVVPELLLSWADAGLVDANGKAIDWNDQANIDALKLPATWHDEQRGYLVARNSWRKDDLQVGFTCKQDFFYGGHEGSENNRLTLAAHGVNWIQDLNMLATKQTFLQNMVTIDGKGLKWPPVPGVWLGTVESPLGVGAAGDGRLGYSFAKRMQVHPLDFPSGKTGYYRSFTEGNFDLTRDLQVAFHPLTVAWNDGYAHTDYGPWSGETRLVEHYQPWNPMEQAYRTVHLAKGERPYVLVLDDLRKDGQTHLYDWNISLPPDSDLVETDAPETAFQAVEPTAKRESSFTFATAQSPRDPKTGRLVPKKGDPLFLVKVLWRNSPYGFPVPRFERIRGHNGLDVQGKAGFAHFTIPAQSVSPEFRVLLYPHRAGDPLPETAWNEDRSGLTVTLGKQVDRYDFAATDGGRTVFRMTRAGQTLVSGLPPARPVPVLGGDAVDPAAARTTRDETTVPTRRFAGRTEAVFARIAPPAVIRYTLDGSEPAENSPVYTGPVALTASATVKARVFDPAWTAGPTGSATTAVRFVRDEPLVGSPAAPAGSRPGLWSRVYETKTVMWDDQGFFRANKVMLPKLDGLEPSHALVSPGVAVPHAGPRHPLTEQAQGFYRWTGWFHAPAAGVYRFAVDSCGPVTLDVGPRGVIDHSGVFHQQQAVRRGQAVLGAGWHPFDLVVCDPQFWNATTQGLMPVGLTIARDDGPAEIPNPAQWACAPVGPVADAPAFPRKDGQAGGPLVEPGVVLSTYLRDLPPTDPAYLDIEGATPRATALVSELADNARPGLVRVYDGVFQVTAAGEFSFAMPRRREANAGLGELRAAYQNQVRVDGEIVVQHGVPGRLPLGRIHLGVGWHTVSVRLGSSPADLQVTWPDGQTTAFTGAWWSRPRTVSVLPEGATVQQGRYELYAPTAVRLALPGVNGAVIRYTVNGDLPTAASPEYREPVQIDATTTITAQAFVAGAPATLPTAVKLVRTPLPTDGLLAAFEPATWGAKPAGIMPLPGGLQASIPGNASLVDGVLRLAAAAEGLKAGVDINLARGGPQGVRISGLRMPDNALTVAVRVRSDGSGRLFGREGINAYGKGIKTLACRLDKNRVQGEPGKLRSPELTPGWHVVAMAVDDKVSVLYVDGQEVARGVGTATLVTESLDLLADHAADLAWARIYDRVLGPADMAALAAAK